MRPLLTLLILFTTCQLWSQSINDYVKKIEQLRRKGELTTKASVDKTFVGSVVAYYHQDSLVLINSLTDGEHTMSESLYYIKNGVLKKYFTSTSLLMTQEKWDEFYSKHDAIDNCYTCHDNPECFASEVTYGKKTIIQATTNGKPRFMSPDLKDNELSDIGKTFKELKSHVKELK